jgi:hypothetical protein
VADLKDLLGTWTMISWKKETIATGEIVDALGPDPVGYITYGADGRMHAIVVRRDRPIRCLCDHLIGTGGHPGGTIRPSAGRQR